ncbi:L-serine ammonia-lyase, iron-sulfur-dependent subunit beta [Paenibacillus methanolicus]|uniref:L-serine deaminase n=1 Tax=Paenibacillus methanolicus TaxID=582686 RepID=A0A5S5C0T2_9BACL|nr:L-serine ammonia-lyase, iron-sulfur-dependent subunit beta [Paenibacillus methanolicus]TYP72056.1 L-serine dehydratase [Paenibacillus methanolicus]
MRFKDVFAIIGPVMIGPSSSHTAGAARIGRAARQALGEPPLVADIVLYGSFADTGQGHGTDTAIVAGLLDMDTDDARIPDAFGEAERSGLEVSLRMSDETQPHPNTAAIVLRGPSRRISLLGRSIGGGSVEIARIDRFAVKFTAVYPTLLIFHEDRAGVIADVSGILRCAHVNIGYMTVDRASRSGSVLTVIECDQAVPADALPLIRGLAGVSDVSVVDLAAKEVR